jgi:hypothetical protein
MLENYIEPKNVIWVFGTSYCGSSMFGLMMSNHPDSVTIGDACKLGQGILHNECLACKSQVRDCILYHPDMKRENIYDHIYNVLGYNNIVDSSRENKWYQSLIDNGVPDKHNITPIFLYKDPVRYAASYVKHWTVQTNNLSKKESMNAAYDTFHRRISKIFTTNIEPVPLVRYVDLVEYPDEILRQVALLSDFPYREHMEDFWNNDHHHFINGNPGIRKLLRNNLTTKLKVDNFYEEIFSNKEIKEIINNEKVLEIIDGMISNFGRSKEWYSGEI